MEIEKKQVESPPKPAKSNLRKYFFWGLVVIGGIYFLYSMYPIFTAKISADSTAEIKLNPKIF